MHPRLLMAIGVALASPPNIAAQAAPDTASAVRSAEGATLAWLAIVDSGRIDRSWEEAALPFQMAVTKAKWSESLKTARGSFEPFGTRERILARFTKDLPNAPAGEYVVLQYRTLVAGGHHVIETVVPMRDGSRGWRVSGYFVRPDQ